MELPTKKLVDLKPVDLIDLTILVDNAIDTLIPSTDLALRPPLPWDYFDREHLIAEHGYSLYLTIFRDGQNNPYSMMQVWVAIPQFTIWTCSVFEPMNYGRLYFRMDMLTIMAVSKEFTSVWVGSDYRSCFIRMPSVIARLFSRPGLNSRMPPPNRNDRS